MAPVPEERRKAMKSKIFERLSSDVLIVGGGGAGLRAAIEAREKGSDVLVVSKSRVGYGNNTYISKGSFAAATGWTDARDNPEVHKQDSLAGGRFLNDRRLVAAVAKDAASQIAFLEKCGVRFFRHDGKIQLRHVPGHSYPRHVRGEHQTGSDFIRPLREYALKIGVRFADRILITRLLESEGRLVGATGIMWAGEFIIFESSCTILATGGFAQVFQFNNNAAGITGDGQSLAYEIGAPLKDMEFVQFYPTALGRFGNRLLMYEALVSNAGAVLLNADGENIAVRHGLTDLKDMTRDRLARAIMQEILCGRDINGGVIMDLSPVPTSKLNEFRNLLPHEKPPEDRKLVVTPTTHFCMGGVIIDENAETEIPGLFAVGEVCAGVHGANRLGGNALSEVFAMGGIAGRNASRKTGEMGKGRLPIGEIERERGRLESLMAGGNGPRELQVLLKETMWRKAGIIREGTSLKEALARVKAIASNLAGLGAKDIKGIIKTVELQNMIRASEMVCRAAIKRQESRGSHYRSDFDTEDNDNWLKNIIIRKRDSAMVLETTPVPNLSQSVVSTISSG
jgi:succinate dehydrogenase/fumarate reductase flavoprotein subunit